ncbi:MAG: hypothetical protein WD118_11645 [Phycisphaeraceae bacterium]
MSRAYVMDFSGGTLDQYNQVLEKMDLGGKTAPGGIFHWVAETEDGFRVVDVWETSEAYDQFAQEKIGPITAEVGLAPPKVQEYEVHNTLAS